MGPRSDERGRREYWIGYADAEALQWGRVRMNAEGARRSGSTPPPKKLQWGRVRMNAEGPSH